jgi:maltokinase
MTPGRSTALALRLAPDRVSLGREREITVDRSNECVVVDEAVFVKWLTPPTRVPHRGLDIVRHLSAVGFDAMPALLGSDVSDGQVRAIAFEHLAGAEDGWTWLFERVNAVDDGTLPRAALITDAARLGALAAELHAALATRSAVFPEPIGTVDRSSERARGHTLLASALDAVAARDQPEAHGALHACRPAIAQLIDSIPNGPTPALSIHGDLHVGQILRSHDRIALIDFDGNPLLVDGTSVAQPPVVDAASLVQSVDHVVRMTQRRRPSRHEHLDAVANAITLAVMDAYCMRLRSLDVEDLFDPALLPALRAMQELHELVYAVRRLPRWAYAPTLALRAMFPEAAER